MNKTKLAILACIIIMLLISGYYIRSMFQEERS